MIDKITFGGRIKTPELPHFEITSLILKCCFEVMNELISRISLQKCSFFCIETKNNFGRS